MVLVLNLKGYLELFKLEKTCGIKIHPFDILERDYTVFMNTINSIKHFSFTFENFRLGYKP